MTDPAGSAVEIRHLSPDEISLISEIDRSERIERVYRVVDGDLRLEEHTFDVPTWDPHGGGPHSVRSVIEFWKPIVEEGAALVGAFGSESLLGLAIVDVELEPGVAWMAFLYVSRSHRGRGVGTALWRESERLARVAGTSAMYVSAAPGEATVQFYMRRGCELAESPHPRLFAMEPKDIHMICRLDRE